MRRTLWAAVALCAAALMVAELLLRPTGVGLVPLVIFLYAALIWWRPQSFLFVLPATLPIASLAQWTGSMYIEEWDLLALATAALIYGKWALLPPPVKPRQVHGIGSLLLGLLALSYFISALRGWWPPTFDLNSLSGYHTHWNSLRIAKAFFYAALLWPLINTYLCRGNAANQRLFAAGLAAALALISVLCLWERVAFPGLLDLTTDYRSTALFWEMHVGGAALDGFFALSFPFGLWLLLRSRSVWTSLLGIALFALATYAVFTTFSRGLYAAYVFATALIMLGAARRSGTSTSWGARAALVCVAIPLVYVFLTSGYRGFVAASGVLIATVALSAQWRKMLAPLRIRAVIFSCFALPLVACAYGFADKGAYFAYATTAGITAIAYFAQRRGPATGAAVIAIAGGPALILAALLVALHWGGEAALASMTVAVLFMLVLAVLNATMIRPLMPDMRHTWMSLATVLVLAGLGAVSAHSFYVAERFSTVRQDMHDRVQHWRTGLAGLNGVADWALGKGVGRFPATYFWNTPDAERPGVHQIATLEGNPALLLSSPKHMLGYGEIYRVGQEVDRHIQGPLFLAMEVRADQDTSVLVEVCQKHLLYNGACYHIDARVKAAPGEWQPIQLTFQGGLAPQLFYAPRLVFFSIGLPYPGRSLYIDNVHLIDSRGHELLSNNQFSAGPAYWFFSSDRDHLPWHIKNLWMNYLFDQGWLGVLSFSLAMFGAMGRLAFTRARTHPLSPYLLASLCAFAIVGLFDSLVDVPRLGFLFFILLFVALFIDPPPEPAHA